MMDVSEMQDKYVPTMRQYMLPIFLGLAGIVILLYGLIQSVLPQEKGEVVFESAEAESASQSAELLTIDVAGAVEKPGVYKLPENARVQDALIAADGMSGEADRVWVAKSLNLAARVSDGGKIYIPFEGETGSVEGSRSVSGGGDVLVDSQSGLININTASESELDTLPGIGPVTAGKIIANRPYGKIEDLVSKKAVGNATFEKIKDLISLY
jgi:competence protein ComEA